MIGFTEEALSRLKEILAREEDPELFLRVRAEGSGCSGYRYTFMLDDLPRKGDRTLDAGGLVVRLDESSCLLLDGSLVDVGEKGFVVVTARAQSGCTTCVDTHRKTAGEDHAQLERAG